MIRSLIHIQGVVHEHRAVGRSRGETRLEQVLQVEDRVMGGPRPFEERGEPRQWDGVQIEDVDLAPANSLKQPGPRAPRVERRVRLPGVLRQWGCLDVYGHHLRRA